MVAFSGCNDNFNNNNDVSNEDLFYQEAQLIIDEIYPVSCSNLDLTYSKLSTYSIDYTQLSIDAKEDKDNIEKAFLEIENGYYTCFNVYPNEECILLSSAQNVYMATFYLKLVKNSIIMRNADSDDARQLIEETLTFDDTELRSFFYMKCTNIHTLIQYEYNVYRDSITTWDDPDWDELDNYLDSKQEYIDKTLTKELESFDVSEPYKSIKENISGLLILESLYVTSLSGLTSSTWLGNDDNIQTWSQRSNDAFNGITNVLIMIDEEFGKIG